MISIGLFLEDQTVEIEDRHGLAGSYALTGKQWKLGESGVLKLSFKGEGIHFEGNLHLDTLEGTFGGRAGGPWHPYKVTGEEGGTSPEGLFFIHTDHLGTPKVITDENQEVVWEASLTPFGTALISVNEFENNLRFPGQYFDRETGLTYNFFRSYDSRTGRFTESDLIGLKGGVNTYEYALNNPNSVYDPFGLEPDRGCIAACTVGGGVVGGGIGFLGGGLLGGTGGTLVAPGPGTVGGVVGGSDIGGTVGAIIGSALGNVIGQAFCPNATEEDREKECEKRREREETLCEAIAGPLYPGNRAQAIAICKSAAFQRYVKCLKGVPESDWPPLTGVDTPI